MFKYQIFTDSLGTPLSKQQSTNLIRINITADWLIYVQYSQELTEEGLKAEIRGLQEEMAKSDLIIAELNITIEDLREYNTKLEHDIFSKEGRIFRLIPRHFPFLNLIRG